MNHKLQSLAIKWKHTNTNSSFSFIFRLVGLFPLLFAAYGMVWQKHTYQCVFDWTRIDLEIVEINARLSKSEENDLCGSIKTTTALSFLFLDKISDIISYHSISDKMSRISFLFSDVDFTCIYNAFASLFVLLRQDRFPPQKCTYVFVTPIYVSLSLVSFSFYYSIFTNILLPLLNAFPSNH